MKYTSSLPFCLLVTISTALSTGLLNHCLYEAGYYFYILVPALVSLLPGYLLHILLSRRNPPCSRHIITGLFLFTGLIFFLARFYISLMEILGWEQWVQGLTELMNYTWFRITQGEVVVAPTPAQTEGTPFLTALFNIADLTVYLLVFKFFYTASARCHKTPLGSHR